MKTSLISYDINSTTANKITKNPARIGYINNIMDDFFLKIYIKKCYMNNI